MTWTCCDPAGVTFCVGCADDIKLGRPLPHVPTAAHPGGDTTDAKEAL